MFDSGNASLVHQFYVEEGQASGADLTRILDVLGKAISRSFLLEEKIKLLLDIDTAIFNRVVHRFLQLTDKPVSQLADFPLVNNTETLVKDDIFRILRESGVGVPAYYEDIEFEVDGRKGTYSRSRSGCFFCFFQQKIEWIWLMEQHPDRFEKAIAYEKEGYTWMDEPLAELAKPERVAEIKREYLKRMERAKKAKSDNSPYLMDSLINESDGCIACFI